MGTLILGEMKKRASDFLLEKYKTARLVLSDVTRAELLAEDATNDELGGPDAKTMTRIAEASFDIDDYWRIVDVLHGRFYNLDWKHWRQSYKALVLLEFLLTHGPEDFMDEFQCDVEIIRELGTFKHVDEKGFNWGASMQKKSERVLKLLNGGLFFREARLKALKITREIKGFGNLLISPTSSSSSTPTSASSSGVPRSSFGSFSTNDTPTYNDANEFYKHHDELMKEKSSTFDDGISKNLRKLHIWDSPPIEETGSLMNPGEEKEHTHGFIDGIRSRLANVGSPSNLRSLSDAGKEMKKRFDRQFSMGY
ncbi:hypothetical protein ACHQM5_027566 [Ranunculus cassubicifolius]